jgi:hypothetical protein
VTWGFVVSFGAGAGFTVESTIEGACLSILPGDSIVTTDPGDYHSRAAGLNGSGA